MEEVSEQIGGDFKSGIRLLARLARVAERSCQESGISLSQYRLLVSVVGRPRRASDLASNVGVSRPALTSMVDGMVQAGLLSREPVPADRRGVELVATDSGRSAVERAECALTERMLQLVDGDAAKVVADVVSAVASALDRERPNTVAQADQTAA
jgi:DNA-binding MarR family transcriptional regulator